MKKRVLAIVCALFLSLPLLVQPSFAAGQLFFLSLNDTLPTNTSQTTPVEYAGWIYVPTTVFSSRVTGVHFGVYYGLTEQNESLVFYNLSGKTMTFNLQDGTAVAEGGDPPVPATVIRQNGLYYVPAYPICRYFGLGYSYYNTEYGPILRIKDENVVLSDSLFLSSVGDLMRSRLYNYSTQNNQTPPKPAPPPTPTPTPPSPVPSQTTVPEVPETPETPPVFSLSVGLQASSKTDVTDSLNALGAVSATAVVFFPADAVADCTEQLRQVVGRGHQVGLIPTGKTAEQRLKSVEEGGTLVAHILRQKTWFVLGNDKTLSDAGYLCWVPTLSLTAPKTVTELYTAVIGTAESGNGRSRVLLRADTPIATLSGVLNQLKKDGDTFRAIKETDY